MPSPFPGMDPFLEGPEWEDFHATFNTVLRELLSPTIEPDHVVRVERRVYVERPLENKEGWFRPDVMILATDDFSGGGVATASGTAMLAEPSVCELPMSQERSETYLVIRERESMEVVTVLETLSPANKRPGEGRKEYLHKRETLLGSETHLIELDLLRGGLRLPMMQTPPLPRGDYFAIVSRAHRRPKADVFAWTLCQPLPTIPIPLLCKDPEVTLDLQAAFTTVYERARYDLSLRYGEPLDPPVDERDAAWLNELLKDRIRR